MGRVQFWRVSVRRRPLNPTGCALCCQQRSQTQRDDTSPNANRFGLQGRVSSYGQRQGQFPRARPATLRKYTGLRAKRRVAVVMRYDRGVILSEEENQGTRACWQRHRPRFLSSQFVFGSGRLRGDRGSGCPGALLPQAETAWRHVGQAQKTQTRIGSLGTHRRPGWSACSGRYAHSRLRSWADDFEYYCHCLASGTGWVVRAKVLSRRVRPFDPKQPETQQAQATESLVDCVAAQKPLGTYMLELKANKSQPARTATVEVRSGSIWMPRPSATSPWVKKHGPRFIRMDVIEVREVNTPKKCEPLHWVLLTDMRVAGFDRACEVIGYYEKRPLIEEYHKAAKTGCQIEERLYRAADRLERIVGILSVIAVRLAQMKTVARVEPERPAAEVAPQEWIEATCDYHRSLSPKQRDKWNPKTLSIRDLIRGIAMMGGFRGRKSDGEPGWIVLWRGVKELLAKLEARREMRQTCGYS